jgi:hypothetical protein
MSKISRAARSTLSTVLIAPMLLTGCARESTSTAQSPEPIPREKQQLIEFQVPTKLFSSGFIPQRMIVDIHDKDHKVLDTFNQPYDDKLHIYDPNQAKRPGTATHIVIYVKGKNNKGEVAGYSLNLRPEKE